jgi:hypothetical protein
MTGLLAIDLFAVVIFALGFLLAFKPGAFRALRGRGADRERGVSEDVASALRIAGVMAMAFSVMICVFANLIVRYSAASAAAGS